MKPWEFFDLQPFASVYEPNAARRVGVPDAIVAGGETAASVASFLRRSAARPLRGWLAGAGTAILAGMSACAGHHHPPPPPAAEMEEMIFRNVVRVLTAEDSGGRRPGTPEDTKTVAFIAGQFQRLGLKPGNGESFYQQVPLLELVTVDPPTLAIGRPGDLHPLRYGKDMVIRSERDLVTSTLEQSAIVFVGYGIVDPDAARDDYARVDVRGKTVIALIGDPGDPGATGSGGASNGGARTAYGSLGYKRAEAARHGAAGFLSVEDPTVAGCGWSTLVEDAATPQLQADSAADSPRVLVAGWLDAEMARVVFRQAGFDFDVQKQAAARAGFAPVTLGLLAQATVHTASRHVLSANVVGVLPGTSHAREYVVYTANWDGLGRGSAAAGAPAHPGAVSDAASVAGLLVLAQSFARARPLPDRSVVFIAFTADEREPLGSGYYVDHPVFPLRDTVAAFDLRLPYVGGPTRDVTIVGAGSELDDYIRAAAQLQGREVRPGWNFGPDMDARSARFEFVRGGVPAVELRSGLDDAARGPAWGRSQWEGYFTRRYHQPEDVYSESWDLRGTLEDLHLDYEVGNRLARSRRFPRFGGAGHTGLTPLE